MNELNNQELIHWGIKGQKWGVRRYQNPDGSLTPEGRKRYATKEDPYGLEKGDLDRNNRDLCREYFIDKNKRANDFLDKEFSKEEVVKQVEYLKESDRRWNKWYNNTDPSKREALKKALDEISNSEEAIKAAEVRKKFIDNEASSRLKKLMDSHSESYVGTSNGGLGVEYEYAYLISSYSEAYVDKFFDREHYEPAVHSDELLHWGIKGQKWGVRRYQNKDGSLTPAGKKRVKEKSHKISDKAKETRNLYLSGKKFVESKFDERTIEFMKDSAAYAAGALWVASAFTSGGTSLGLNGLAALTNMLAIVADD